MSKRITSDADKVELANITIASQNERIAQLEAERFDYEVEHEIRQQLEAELTTLREKVKQADALAAALDALIKWEIEPTSGLLEEMLEQERKLQADGLAALADWHKAKGE